MTAKETLDQHVHSDLTDRWPEPVLTAVLIAMETFALQQVKQSKKPVVITDEQDTERNFNKNSRW